MLLLLQLMRAYSTNQWLENIRKYFQNTLLMRPLYLDSFG
jgi:hypothetical protein